jgi:hypothetical protein
MNADVILDDFPHQTIDGASGGCDPLQDIGAADFLLQGSLNRFHLPANSVYTVEELGFLSSGLKHEKLHLILY